MLTANEEQ